MKEVKNFYISITFLGTLFVALILKGISNSFEMFLGLGLILYFFCWFVVFTLRELRMSIKLPFLTDLVDSPTTPTYRISKDYQGDNVVIKSEVGYTYFDEDFGVFFPPILLIEYKTMVDFENKFEIEGSLEDISKVDLKDFWESEYFNKHQEYIESQEIIENGKKLLEQINKQYLNNFNDR